VQIWAYKSKIAPVIHLDPATEQRYFFVVASYLHQTAGLLPIPSCVQFENIRFSLYP
jgi:hypothetical protein